MQKDPDDADDLTFERGSENVFADLGLENADELLVNADLAITINKEIRARGWTRIKAAEVATFRWVTTVGEHGEDCLWNDAVSRWLRCWR